MFMTQMIKDRSSLLLLDDLQVPDDIQHTLAHHVQHHFSASFVTTISDVCNNTLPSPPGVVLDEG